MNNEIQNRTKAIRAATPNCLKELFEMSNRKCDLCGYFIQDLILAVIEHSIPVTHFAKNFGLSIDEAVQQANDLSNLRVAHSYCNHVKKDKTREEWFNKGLDKTIEKPKEMSKEDLALFKIRLGAAGRKTLECKIGIFNPAFNLSEAGKKGGLIGGQKALESGHIQELGRKNVESGFIQDLGKNPKYREDKIRGAKIAGRKAVESGQLDWVRNLPQTKEAQKKTGIRLGETYGNLNGRKAVESGQLAKARSIEGSIKGGKKRAYYTNHKRWHLDRGILNPDCALCVVNQG